MANQTIRKPNLAANFILLSGGEFISKLFAFAAFAYLARILGPSSFGNLEFVLAIIIFFTLFVDFGLSPYGAREIAKAENSVPLLAAHITIIRCLLAAVAFSLLVIFVIAINRPWPLKQLTLLYGLTLFALPGLLPWVFQGRDLMKYVAIASVIRWSLFAAGVFLFIREPAQIWIVPLVEGSALICATVFYLFSFTRHFGSFRQRIETTFALSLFRQAWPIGASELVWVIKVYFATVFLGVLVSSSEVGWFGAAHRIVISLHAFVWLYFFNLLPSIARCSKGPPEPLHGLMQTSIQVTAWSGVFLSMMGTVFAEPVIALVYGSQYHQSIEVFQVLIWLIPLALISGHYRYVLIAYDRQRLEFLTAACGAAMNVSLNLFLIPYYGLLGAAWTLLASEALIWGLASYFVRRTITQLSVWPPVSRPILAVSIIACILYLLPPINIWMTGSSAILIYCLVLSISQPKILANARSLFLASR